MLAVYFALHDWCVAKGLVTSGHVEGNRAIIYTPCWTIWVYGDGTLVVSRPPVPGTTIRFELAAPTFPEDLFHTLSEWLTSVESR